jgi:hypothetical protein
LHLNLQLAFPEFLDITGNHIPNDSFRATSRYSSRAKDAAKPPWPLFTMVFKPKEEKFADFDDPKTFKQEDCLSCRVLGT